MVKCSVSACLIVYTVINVVNCVAAKEPCESSCIPAADCQFFGNLKNDDQRSWIDRYSCEDRSKNSRLVCCPENVWQIDNAGKSEPNNTKNGTPNIDGVTIEKKSNFPFMTTLPQLDGMKLFPDNWDPFQDMFGSTTDPFGDDKMGDPFANFDDMFGEKKDAGIEKENTRLWQNRQRPMATTANPYFLPANQNQGSFNSFNRRMGGQCQITSLPPDPESGCCGLEAGDSGAATAAQYPQSNQMSQNSWMPQVRQPMMSWPSWMSFSDTADRKKREAETPEVTIDNRIAGGRDTDLEQFPWTVLLKTTFSYPDKEAAFSCGGSLVSSRYVLTAGHCVYDQKGTIKEVEVYLAEYDKRTFPTDCKNVLGQGQKCVENIVMKAESVHIHPRYDDNRLHNDIALLRLKGDAPYTDYIRPICLPPLNVDSPDLSHLRLAVAGWGRIGRFKSNVKQSTVVNLVPNEECGRSYPGITKKQMCAAGYSGEDTCKGDSGGPLMMVYGGKYYVSGVVSGKRADAPCGTSVPSLYTNVYTYLRWIKSIIKP